ncbi:MAG: hypothetical protein IPP34_08855 [Bacteroidetes bacterium]|nr:hypothetical protein [Bacteroidota bacterium]MBL0071905.1 hypothetical protein [Bacteroidota bacterium]
MRNHKLLPICLLFIILFSSTSKGQVTELETFRKTLTHFVFYDRNQIDSLPKTDELTKSLTEKVKDDFRKFVLHPESKSIDNLKSQAKTNKSSYWFNNYSYFFHSLKYYFGLNPDSTLNLPVVESISFYGLYNYSHPDFILLYIERFESDNLNFAIYSYVINNTTLYFIKDIGKNKIVFERQIQTNGVPISGLYRIDANHVLLVEDDLNQSGQSALVVATQKDIWEPINAFKGMAYLTDSNNKLEKKLADNRMLMKLVSTKTIGSVWGTSSIRNSYGLFYDNKSGSLCHKILTKKGGTETKTICAVWTNNMFEINDYYLGDHLDDSDIPFPSMD